MTLDNLINKLNNRMNLGINKIKNGAKELYEKISENKRAIIKTAAVIGSTVAISLSLSGCIPKEQRVRYRAPVDSDYELVFSLDSTPEKQIFDKYVLNGVFGNEPAGILTDNQDFVYDKLDDNTDAISVKSSGKDIGADLENYINANQLNYVEFYKNNDGNWEFDIILKGKTNSSKTREIRYLVEGEKKYTLPETYGEGIKRVIEEPNGEANLFELYDAKNNLLDIAVNSGLIKSYY
ncbi:MAG: hypothetical protein GWP09_00605 [Nitrospiraceae bacterium]|nr:hypothetical protein [Nitrospiraceae bacterium]